MTGPTMSAARKATLVLHSADDASRKCPLDRARQVGWMGGYRRYTILVEELTATWCARCAEIDLDLGIVAQEHGKRIAMVSYHPEDGVDAFGPEAAQHRIERLEIQHGKTPGYPSFVVNNGELRQDVASWPDVQSDILRAESNQRDYTEPNSNNPNQ